MEAAQLIQKEQLSEIQFPKVDVLNEKDAFRQREIGLWYGLHLGNDDHTKVKIFFITNNGTHNQVETTIWAVTEESVCLKGYLYIPKKAIVKIEF